MQVKMATILEPRMLWPVSCFIPTYICTPVEEVILILYIYIYLRENWLSGMHFRKSRNSNGFSSTQIY